MKTLLLPPREADPFLQRLAPALESSGVQVADLADESVLQLARHRFAGFRVLHLHGIPFTQQHRLQRLLRWLAFLRIRMVWAIGTTLPRGARAEEVENLQLLFHAARVRIVSSEDVRERLRHEFGLSATTLVVSPNESPERLAEAMRTAYATSLEDAMPVDDASRPPRA